MAEIWGVVAAVGVGVIGGVMQGNEADQQQQNSIDQTNLTTQRDAWLAQQQQAFSLQNAATNRAQKSADIGVFQKYQSDPSQYKPSGNQWAAAAQGALPTWDPTQKGTLPQFLATEQPNATGS